MSRSAFLSRRSLKVLLLAVAVAAVCVRLGIWQVSRLHERNAFVAALDRGLAASPVPIDELLPAGVTADPEAIRYRRVQVTGTYDPSHEVVLYGRGLSAEVNGNHVLTPLLMSDGRAIVVDRGWVPERYNDPPVGPAAPPAGPVALTGILIPSEGGLPGEGGGPRVTETRRVDLAQLSSQLPYPIEPLYLLLRSQDPAPSSLPRPAPFLLPDAPPHLSYAIQWFSFATIALVGAAILIRRDSPSRPAPSERTATDGTSGRGRTGRSGRT
ncbi:MAG: SURF1 family protein [Actinobacteria bacterium]|nr:SURF1 family protein [Actinomycetota bacterium]